MGSLAHPKDVVRRFYARVINDRDVDAIDELLTADFRHNDELRGREGQKQTVDAFLLGFSDLRNEILIMIAEGDLVSAHQRWSGTHDGEFMGSPGNGRRVSFTSTAILRVDGEQIAEAWDVIDVSLAPQLQ